MNLKSKLSKQHMISYPMHHSPHNPSSPTSNQHIGSDGPHYSHFTQNKALTKGYYKFPLEPHEAMAAAERWHSANHFLQAEGLRLSFLLISCTIYTLQAPPVSSQGKMAPQPTNIMLHPKNKTI